MPKTLLTQAQKEADDNEKRRDMIAYALAGYQNRHRLSNEALAKGLGIGRVTVSKILKGEDAHIGMDKMFKILAICGFRVFAPTPKMPGEEGMK